METAAALVLTLLALIASYTAARRLYSTPLSALAVAATAAGSFVLGDLLRDPSLPASFTLAIVASALMWLRSRVAVVAVAAAAIALRGWSIATAPARDPIDALWSLPDGLFATSPAVYLAAIGFIPLWTRDRAIATAALSVFTLALATTGSPINSDGAGHFAVMVPFLVIGMAAALDVLMQFAARRPLLTATAGLSVLVLWNVTLVGVTRAGGHRSGEPVSFGDLGANQAAMLHDWIGHPPSYPANLIYAARHGVAPGRYDVLRPARFFAGASRQESIDIGGTDAIFLQDGWHAAERAGPLTFRWSQRESRLIVPLDHPAPLRVALRLRAFSYPGSAPQTMVLAINDRPLPPLAIGPEWNDVQWDVPADFWRGGINRLALRFTYEARPVDVGQGGDQRLLAGAVDTIQFLKSQ